MRLLLVHSLAVVLVTGLVLTVIGSGVVVIALRAGVAPDFDERIALSAQHILVLHNGPQPTCTAIPNPPQHDCFRHGPEHRMFSVDYLTPHGGQVLAWFGLPPRDPVVHVSTMRAVHFTAMAQPSRTCCPASSTGCTNGSTIARKIRINQPANANEQCVASNLPAMGNDFSPHTDQFETISVSTVIALVQNDTVRCSRNGSQSGTR
jgi:hypothetical protein